MYLVRIKIIATINIKGKELNPKSFDSPFSNYSIEKLLIKRFTSYLIKKQIWIIIDEVLCFAACIFQ